MKENINMSGSLRTNSHMVNQKIVYQKEALATNVIKYEFKVGDGISIIENIDINSNFIKFLFPETLSQDVEYLLTKPKHPGSDVFRSAGIDLIIKYSQNDNIVIKNFLHQKVSIELEFINEVVSNREFLDKANVQYWLKNESRGLVQDTGTDNLGGSDIIYYYFPTEIDNGLNDFEDYFDTIAKDNSIKPLTNSQETIVNAIFNNIEDYINVKFINVNSLLLQSNLEIRETNIEEFKNSKSLIVLQNVDFQKEGITGHTYFKNHIQSISIDERFSKENSDHISTYTHEILHALWLRHPDQGDFAEHLTELEKNWSIVATANNIEGGKIDYPLAFDVAALQAIYGVNPESRNSNDIYFFDSKEDRSNVIADEHLIWDGGGMDTIKVKPDETKSAFINLEEGAWSYIGEKTQNISDRYQLSINHNTVIENAEGAKGADTLIGNSADNILYGKNGSDILIGGLGRDRLIGGEGEDIMYGGEGSDIYMVDNIKDEIIEFIQQGTDSVFTNINFTLPDNVEQLYMRGTATEGYGNDLNNRLYGNEYSNVLKAGKGNDLVEGGDGRDFLYGEEGSDKIMGQNGNDYLNGGSGEDRLEGGDGDDDIFGSSGSDTLLGEAGSDDIFGGFGSDFLSGGDGIDVLHGGQGKDIFYLDCITSKDIILDYTDEDIIRLDSDAFSRIDKSDIYAGLTFNTENQELIYIDKEENSYTLLEMKNTNLLDINQINIEII